MPKLATKRWPSSHSPERSRHLWAGPAFGTGRTRLSTAKTCPVHEPVRHGSVSVVLNPQAAHSDPTHVIAGTETTAGTSLYVAARSRKLSSGGRLARHQARGLDIRRHGGRQRNGLMRCPRLVSPWNRFLSYFTQGSINLASLVSSCWKRPSSDCAQPLRRYRSTNRTTRLRPVCPNLDRVQSRTRAHELHRLDQQ